MGNHSEIQQLTAHLFRESSGKMMAVLSRLFGLSKIDLAQDIIQDTFETALLKWRFSGIPDNPSAWLMQVAKNKALNVLKRESKTQPFSPSDSLNPFEPGFENQLDFLLSPEEIKDSQLRLLYTCCHPGLSAKNQIIITLDILCGFGVPEIANALLMQEEAVKKALQRSKASLRNSDQTFYTNMIAQAAERTDTVLTVLYLMFNEGYKTTRSKEAINYDLCFEAVRLAKLLESRHSETNALLALMFFNLSRFTARLNTSNEWLTLEEQDRSQWNKIFIEEGCYYLNKSIPADTVTRFHIEALIASLHCSASTFAETDWGKIAALYHQLELLEPASPHITLNRIIAESYLPDADSLKDLQELEANAVLKNSFLISAAKGAIYKRKGEIKHAQHAFEQAYDLAVSATDKTFLRKKILQMQVCIN